MSIRAEETKAVNDPVNVVAAELCELEDKEDLEDVEFKDKAQEGLHPDL